MQLIKEDNQEGVGVRLQGDLTIYTVADLRKELLPYFPNPRAIIICLAQVQACDTAGIQLLAAVRRGALEDSTALVLTEASLAVREAATRMGLDPALLFADA